MRRWAEVQMVAATETNYSEVYYRSRLDNRL